MILAACVPSSSSGWLGLVIAQRDATGLLRVLRRWGAELGYNVPLAEPIPRKGGLPSLTHRRELTPEFAQCIAADAVALLETYGATALTIERAHGRKAIADRARTMGEALAAAAIEAGITVEIADSAGGYGSHIDAGRLAEIVGWAEEEALPEGERPRDTERRAALLLLPREERAEDGVSAKTGREDPGDSGLDRSKREQTEPDRSGVGEAQHGGGSQRIQDPRCDDPPGDTSRHDAGYRSMVAVSAGADREPIAPSLPKLAPRTGGIDAGTAHVGVAVTEGDVPPLVHIASKEFVYGREARTKKGTATRTFTDSDTLSLADEIDAFFKLHQVDRIIVENSENIYRYRKADKSIDVGRTIGSADEVVKTNHIAALTLGILIGRGYEAFPSVTAISARSRIAPKKRTDTRTKKERVKAMLREHVPNWPLERERSDADSEPDHERDAGVLCIYAGLLWRDAASESAGEDLKAADVPKRPRKPPRERPRGQASAKRRAAQAARVAAGCSCRSPQHKRACPLYVPQAAARDIMDALGYQGPQTRADLCDFGSADSELRERALDMLVAQGDVELDGELYRIATKPRATTEDDGSKGPAPPPPVPPM